MKQRAWESASVTTALPTCSQCPQQTVQCGQGNREHVSTQAAPLSTHTCVTTIAASAVHCQPSSTLPHSSQTSTSSVTYSTDCRTVPAEHVTAEQPTTTVAVERGDCSDRQPVSQERSAALAGKHSGVWSSAREMNFDPQSTLSTIHHMVCVSCNCSYICTCPCTFYVLSIRCFECFMSMCSVLCLVVLLFWVIGVYLGSWVIFTSLIS